MSERNIAYLTDVYLITCVVGKGKGEEVVSAARGAGAAGALIHSVHGVGMRERLGLLAIAVDAEKDVVNLMVGSEHAEMVANIIYATAGLDRPGAGFIYLTPLEAVATYLPNEIRERLKEHKV
ncbi:MAG: P-II family nitrogen regulator [Pseudomonadota bacterium]